MDWAAGYLSIGIVTTGYYLYRVHNTSLRFYGWDRRNWYGVFLGGLLWPLFVPGWVLILAARLREWRNG